MTELSNAVGVLNSLIPDATGGLREDVFLLVSRLLPLVNVDLLVQGQVRGTLLTWRDDAFYGPGWHVPGGISASRNRWRIGFGRPRGATGRRPRFSAESDRYRRIDRPPAEDPRALHLVIVPLHPVGTAGGGSFSIQRHRPPAIGVGTRSARPIDRCPSTLCRFHRPHAAGWRIRLSGLARGSLPYAVLPLRLPAVHVDIVDPSLKDEPIGDRLQDPLIDFRVRSAIEVPRNCTGKQQVIGRPLNELPLNGCHLVPETHVGQHGRVVKIGPQVRSTR